MKHLWMYFCVWAALTAAFMTTGCSGEKESGIPGILVSTDWLQDHLNDPDVLILHSGTEEGFDTIHIPGARLIIPFHFTVGTDLLRNEMPHADRIVELLRSVGAENDSKIVLYHESSRLLSRTARVFVTLDHMGLGERTFVLNGGLPAWKEEERETSDVAPEISQGNMDLLNLKEVVIESAELERQRWSNDVVVIDTRTDEEYYGTPETEEESAEGGHIEGAYSLSYLKITTDESPYLFRSDTELKELFREAGMDPEKVTLFYCNSGIKGSLVYLVARHLGYPALLYDGSYEEWEELDLPFTGPVAIPDKNE
jgi:thiosulfate/3-mercaptopyruvate sulfurtransferase